MSSHHRAVASHDGEGWSVGYAWVTDCPVDDFKERMQAMREGERPVTDESERPRPANAIRALNAFAVRRPIDELIESAADFDYRDAVHVLATAALSRETKHAAELAVRLWDAEREGNEAALTPLTDGIIHDVACQRTILDVAVFARQCRRLNRRELVDKTLRMFTRTSSGRTNLDKALFYIALRDEDCGDEAAELLRQTLAAVDYGATREPDGDPAELYDLVGVLHHLSPAERVLEEWVDAQLRHPDRVLETRRIVARLIAGRVDGPDGSDPLVEHVGERLSQHDIVDICGELAKKAPDSCARIRAHAASRGNIEHLAEIVIAWYRSTALAKTTRDLLADVVAKGSAGEAGPRPPEELERLSKVLGNFRADPECRRMLWIAAAAHTEGRSGADLVTLLNKVERPRDRHRTAQTIARRLTARVIDDSADTALFSEYVTELRKAGSAEAAYLACKELADPSAADPAREGMGEVIADVAVRLYGAGLEDDAWDLLERYLENEQHVTPQDAVVITARLRDTAMPEDDRHFLLRATVGRWSDTHRREEAVTRLRRRRFDAEAAEVIRSLR